MENSTIEGGDDAKTYCVPQDASCSGAKPVTKAKSEQNFQSVVLSTLKRQVRGNMKNPPDGVWQFWLYTVNNPDEEPAYVLRDPDSDSDSDSDSVTRDVSVEGRDPPEGLRSVHRILTTVHENLTISERRIRIDSHEVMEIESDFGP